MDVNEYIPTAAVAMDDELPDGWEFIESVDTALYRRTDHEYGVEIYQYESGELVVTLGADENNPYFNPPEVIKERGFERASDALAYALGLMQGADRFMQEYLE